MTKETGTKAALRAKGFIPAVEAAEKIGFTPQSVYDWMDSKPPKIHGVRLGAGRWVEWKSVVAYFKASSPEAAKLVGLT